MEIQELYDLIESHLDNGIISPQEKMGRLKRTRLPIPKEYGGGIVTGYGYEDTIRNLVSRIQKQIKMEVEKPVFEECFDSWIAIKEGQNKSPSTIANYRYIYKKYLCPYFTRKAINQITPDDIQNFFNSIMNKSKSISNQSYAILKGIFNRSAMLGDVDKNIMLYTYERSNKTGKKVVLQDDDLIHAISQLKSLRDAGYGRGYLYFCFLCFTALRRGEILGLRWKDFDFVASSISVRNNVTFPNGQNEPVVCKPKDGSYGIVLLQSELKKQIEPYKGDPNAYVLPYSKDEPTRPMTKSMFVKMWKRIAGLIDLKGATSHSFRASYATMMNAHCDHVDPKVLQGALRHKTPDLALKVYTKENFKKTRIAEKEYDKWLSEKLAF